METAVEDRCGEIDMDFGSGAPVRLPRAFDDPDVFARFGDGAPPTDPEPAGPDPLLSTVAALLLISQLDDIDPLGHHNGDAHPALFLDRELDHDLGWLHALHHHF